jgi:cobalt-zinc-cadmium efflux system outer membrane protein
MPDDERMRFCHCHFALLAGLLLSQPVRAQTSAATLALPPATVAVAGAGEPARSAVTLGQAIERFRHENLRLLAARYEVSAARAEIIAAGLWPNPRLALGGEFHVHGQSDSAQQQVSVLLSQSLPIWGRLGENQNAARLTASAAEQDFAAVAFRLLAELRQAYLALQMADARERVLSAGLKDLERVERVLDARTAAGANPAYDRLRLELERGSLRARIAQAELEVSQTRADLAAAIGGAAPTGELYASDVLAEPVVDVRDAATLARQALVRRYEISATRLAASAADARLAAVRRRFLPEPELGLGYARWSGIPGAASGSAGGALLASASIPLPVFDRGQGSIEQQVEQSRAAHVREQDLKNTVEREVERALESARLAITGYLSYRDEASRNAETVRQIAELTYREGRGTILELLDAYASYLRVTAQALELRGAALFAALELERATGR